MGEIKAVVFDLDGVVYKGDRGIPGVAGEIFRLQHSVQVLYLTNNATKSRADYVRHLALFGMEVHASQVMTSSYGCARYVEEKYGRGKKVFVIGEQGLRDELETETGAVLVEGEGAEIIVVGLDRGLTYQKLGFALKNLNNGAAFVLANSDPTLPTENGVLPGTGSIAALLIYASGRKPDAVIGKPSTYLMDILLEMHRIKPKEAAFVGDRLDIDIRMANKVGMKSVLVLTGIASKSDLKVARASDRPDIVLKTAEDVGKALKIC